MAFGQYFTAFFGGGSSALLLTDPENIAESGIEIEAQPPGKRIKSLSLLSGGERSLTAVALLFALLSANPAPFCVLDEVDAALDEANVGRFTSVVATAGGEDAVRDGDAQPAKHRGGGRDLRRLDGTATAFRRCSR